MKSNTTRKHWERVADEFVQHVWKKAPDDDCGEGPDTAVVSPGWYENNGTPSCSCGEDMVYSHTEILTDWVRREAE